MAIQCANAAGVVGTAPTLGGLESLFAFVLDEPEFKQTLTLSHHYVTSLWARTRKGPLCCVLILSACNHHGFHSFLYQKIEMGAPPYPY